MSRFAAIPGRVASSLDRGLSLMAYGLVLVYRRFLSPHKGFRCAHSFLTGGPSCSTVAVGLLRDGRLSQSFPAIQQQRQLCRNAYQGTLNRGVTFTEQILNAVPLAEGGGNIIFKCC